MKKIISVLIAAILLLCSGCVAKPTQEQIDNYVGEGMMMNFKVMFSGNETLVNEVFVYNHLPIDEKQTVESDGKTYARVLSAKFRNYDSIISAVNSIYASKVAKDIISKYNFYKEINGKLYYDMSANIEKKEGVKWIYDNIEVKSIKDDKYVFGILCYIDGEESSSEFTVILENGEWRLDEFYVK